MEKRRRRPMRDVLVSENVVGDEMDALKRSFDVAFEPQLFKDREKLLRSVGDCRAIIVRNQTKVDRELIAAAKHLKVIGRAGVGLDNVDVKAASEAGVVVVWTPEQNSISVAELAIGMMLSLARGDSRRPDRRHQGRRVGATEIHWRGTVRQNAWHCRAWPDWISGSVSETRAAWACGSSRPTRLSARIRSW